MCRELIVGAALGVLVAASDLSIVAGQSMDSSIGTWSIDVAKSSTALGRHQRVRQAGSSQLLAA